MHGILRVSNFPSGNVMTFLRSCHKMAWNSNKYVRNDFNVHASVSIDNTLYVCKIHAYDIEYLSGPCLFERVGYALVVR